MIIWFHISIGLWTRNYMNKWNFSEIVRFFFQISNKSFFVLLKSIFLSRSKILYSRIAVALWRSSQGIEHHIAMHNTSACNSENHGNAQTSQNTATNRTNTKYEKRPVGTTESQVVKFIKLITILMPHKSTFEIQICFFTSKKKGFGRFR